MSQLKLTLTSLQGVVQDTAPLPGEQPGDLLTATISIQASLGTGGLRSPGLALPEPKRYTVKADEWPWTGWADDPTDANPTGWGYRIAIAVPGCDAIKCPLTPEAIAAVAQVDGVRTIALEDYAGLSDKLGMGSLVTAGLAGEAADAAAASALAAAGSATAAAASAVDAQDAALAVGGAAIAFWPDPTNPDLVIIEYPSYLTADDGTSVVIPIGA